MAFDPGALAIEYSRAASDAMAELAGGLAGAMRLDIDRGTMEVDAAAVRAASESSVAGSAGANLAANLIAYAEGGAVSLPGSVVMPWMALEDVTYFAGGCPAGLREALGVAGSRDRRGAAVALHRAYPALPDEVFAPPMAGLLLRDPSRFARPTVDDGPDPPEPTARPPHHNRPAADRTLPHAGNVTLGPAADGDEPTIDNIVRCVLAGQWGPLWDGFLGTGWAVGFRVCISHDCADALATYLMRFFAPGPSSLVSGFAAAIRAGTVAAGIQSLVSVFSLWLALATFTLGAQIFSVNAGNDRRGVCLCIPWPHTGIPEYTLPR